VPGIINKAALQSFYTDFLSSFNDGLIAAMTRDADYKKFTKEETTTAERVQYGWLDDLPTAREWKGTRHIHGIGAGTYDLLIQDWEVTLGIPLNDLTREKAGMNRKKVMSLPMALDKKIERDAWDRLVNGSNATNLCHDGQPFFDAAHPRNDGTTQSNENTAGGGVGSWHWLDTSDPEGPIKLIWNQKPRFIALDQMSSSYVFLNKRALYGSDASYVVGYGQWFRAYQSDQPLTEDTSWAAYEAFLQFTDREGVPYGHKPDTFVCGAANALEAHKLFTVGRYFDGTQYVDSPFKGMGIKVIVNPWADIV
jgi:phage major head subunit gpT-like protein